LLKKGLNFFDILFLQLEPFGPIVREIIKRHNLFSYKWRLERNLVKRPNYAYCVYQGAQLAKRLNYKRCSVIELGVAAGNGLIDLEYHAEKIANELNIEIEVYGFDTGEGLPPPSDYRDLLYWWQEGFF
jgi:hypothetical protein